MQDNSKLIEEYRSIKNFMEKYSYYHKEWRNFIEPLNPLMKEFDEATKALYENNERVSIKGVGSMDDKYRDAQLRKFNADDNISKYFKDNDLEEPKPSKDVDGGQVIKFWVNSYRKELTVEDMKNKLSELIKDEDDTDEIIVAQIDILQLELNKINGVENLEIRLSETYEVNFKKIYRSVRIDNEKLKTKDPIKAYTHPICINYESLAKAIPLIQYKQFLEDSLKALSIEPACIADESKPKVILQKTGEKFSLRQIALLYYYDDLTLTDSNKDKEVLKYGWNSGKKLFEWYCKVKKYDSERLYKPTSGSCIDSVRDYIVSERGKKNAELDLMKCSANN